MDLYITITANDILEANSKLVEGCLELGLNISFFDFSLNYFNNETMSIDFIGCLDNKWLINIRALNLDWFDSDLYTSGIDGFKLNSPEPPIRMFA